MEKRWIGGPVGVDALILRIDGFGERLRFCAGLRQICFGFYAADHGVKVGSAIGEQSAVEGKRHPEVGVFGKAETGGHHTYNRIVFPV